MATTKAMVLADLLDGNGDVVNSALDNASSLFGLPTGWTIGASGNDMIFSYSGAGKFKIGTNGSVTAIDDITAFGSV